MFKKNSLRFKKIKFSTQGITFLFFVLSAMTFAKNKPSDAKNMRHGFVFQENTADEKEMAAQLKLASKENGKKLFQSMCFHCHGIKGKGDGGVAKELNLRPADLSKLLKSNPGKRFFVQIKQGSENGMPAWQDALKDQEVWDLIAYLKTLN